MERAIPIGVVSNLTGVSTSTIRAWERRYKVPVPDRSPNGRRSYDSIALKQVRLMSRLVAAGLPPSMAAERIRSGLNDELDVIDVDLTTTSATDSSLNVDLSELLQAVDHFDGDALAHRLKRMAMTLPSNQLFSDVIGPLMRTLNQRWQSFEDIDRAQEYITTESIRRVLNELSELVRPSLPRGRALIAPFLNDVHELPLDALSFMLSLRGFRIVQMGPMTSPSALGKVIARVKPDLIALSVSNSPDKAELDPWLKQYQEACDGKPWIVGGVAAGSIASRLDTFGATVVLNGLELDEYLRTFIV